MADDFTQEHITMALMAVVAWAGNYSAAARDLQAKGLTVKTDRLKRWCTDLHREQFEEIRDRYSDQMEKQMAHEFRDVAAQAVQLQKLSLERAERRMLTGDDNDPAKTAMMASRVSHTAVDKLMQLTSRPVKITENRNVEELVRSLAAMGVLTPLPAGSTMAVADDESEGEADEA